MATIDYLVSTGRLERVETELGPREQPERLIYGTASFINWLDNVLQTLETTVAAPITPLEQVDDLLHRFEIGEPMDDERLVKPLYPHSRGVWEMKTPDIRIFGWFPQRGVFVSVVANDVWSIKEHSLYAGYIGQVARERQALMGPDETFLTGDMRNVV
jgi:hypothetical protein